jgi:hypothetical protein
MWWAQYKNTLEALLITLVWVYDDGHVWERGEPVLCSLPSPLRCRRCHLVSIVVGVEVALSRCRGRGRVVIARRGQVVTRLSRRRQVRVMSSRLRGSRIFGASSWSSPLLSQLSLTGSMGLGLRAREGMTAASCTVRDEMGKEKVKRE